VMDVAATTLDVVSEKIEKLHVNWSARLLPIRPINRPKISLYLPFFSIYFLLFWHLLLKIVFLFFYLFFFLLGKNTVYKNCQKNLPIKI
jgi:hypothetical protein